jgi:ubiquinone/menaquinone biosynthesis C-methylase UbiE
MERLINKSMDRDDLLTEEARPVVNALNHLIREMYSRRLHMTSWYGSLPGSKFEPRRWRPSFLSKHNTGGVGLDNRGPDYDPLPDSADDGRIPWYLYWEIFWVLTRGPALMPKSRILDAGGTSSLFSCYLASVGHEVHSIDLNDELVANATNISRVMKWDTRSYVMNMQKLDFDSEYFDHAYSICVFEHLDYDIKQAALREIARVLKPGGWLCVTFDYLNPAPALAGKGRDASARNQLNTWADIQRSFLMTDLYELVGNQGFHDNQKRYLVDPDRDGTPYSFGAIFLKKRDLKSS